MFHKEKTMFRKILFPLILLVCIQAAIFWITILVSGTLGKIDRSSVNIMEQTAENRKMLLENNMTQSWSNLAEEVNRINGQLRELLRSQNITMDQFLADKVLQNNFLLSSIDTAASTIRKNQVNGSFIVLANQEFIDQGEGKLVGLYFRDLDPTTTPADYSDILMERGDAAFNQKFNIPFDALWTSQFAVSATNSSDNYDYFNKPFFTAREMGDIGFRNLGYWSNPFYLNPGNVGDGYEMITYSVPLMINGQAYGVLGVDISLQYLTGLLPSRELSYTENGGGYMILVRDDTSGKNESFRINVSAGVVPSTIAGKDYRVGLTKEPKFDSFYDIEGIGDGKEQLCGTLHQLNLYNSNTPFSSQSWYFMAVSTRDHMFTLSRELMVHMATNVFVYIILGLGAVYVTATMATRPLRRLVTCIRGSQENKVNSYTREDIKEINELYDVIEDLTKQQKLTENALVEEKDRYQAALESSTAALFEYDAVNDSLCLYNFISNRSKRVIPLKIYSNWKSKLQDTGFVCEEDQEIIEDIFTQDSDYKKCTFRVNFDQSEDGYTWTQLQGKSIYDSNHRVIKIIGSFRDVQEEKMRQIKEEEAQRKDSLTGLNNKREGIKKIQESFHKCSRGCLLMFDVDQFQALNDKLGSVVGDVVLEEIGKKLEKMTSSEDVALRYGSDDFAIWFPGQTGEDIEKFYSILSWHLMGCSELSALEIRINGGYSEIYQDATVSVQQAFKRALTAMLFGKDNGGSGLIKYSTLSEEDKHMEISDLESAMEMSGTKYDRSASITSLIFNMFEKSDDLKKIMPILLLKIGRYFGFTDIVMLQVDHSFYTNYISGQWHIDNENIPEQVFRYSEAFFKECQGMVANGHFEYCNSTSVLTSEQRDFFKIKEDVSVFCYPIIIGSVWFGSISFMGAKDSSLDHRARGSLEEVVKIISTNLGKARSDLASKAKSDFLSRMSHEIRTPMNAIIGMAEIARRRENLPEDTAVCLKKIDSSSKYLLSIINDILDMSRIESGKMKLALGTLNLDQLMEDVDTLIRPQAEARKLNFSIRLEDVKHTMLVGDNMRLNQILINLLGNAIKFTPEDGNVTLIIKQLQLEDGRVSLYFAVEDTGIGINKTNQERIFHAFEQEESNTATQYGGTGLGLAISSSLVKMMGGSLELSSELGVGSTFFFTITCDISEEEAVASKKNVEVKYDFTGKKVLLVEDNELNTEIARTLLEADGFIVDTAENGQIGVEKFVNSEIDSYDAILMDIRMPVMDGLEATVTIRNSMREDSRTVLIIAMSANAFDEDMKKSIESGMDGHLVKPIDMKQLRELLGSLFEKKSFM